MKKFLYMYFSQKNQEEEIEIEIEEFSKVRYLKMALLDLPISVIDIFSDFAVGIALFSDNSTTKYGIFSFCLNWMPGLVVILHIFSKEPSINYIVHF